MEDYRFKVNLGGMIEILSDHLYSSPDVFIRELLQNGVDAITGRKKANSELFEGQISLDLVEESSLVFTDNGQGLTREEIHRFLAIIGESSKRNVGSCEIQSDYIGRFGIGLLSCFMVSDEIKMLTRSCLESSQMLAWVGKPDGTYTISEVPEQNIGSEPGDDGFVGTKVILHAKPGMEHYFTREKIEQLITYYGVLLPYPIIVRQEGNEKQINPVYLPWQGRSTNKPEMMLFGQMMFGEPFFDCIPFRSEAGGVEGVAYILNYSVLPSAKVKNRIFLKKMLLTEKGDGLIPDWAVFTKCIVNAETLRPSVSREGFYNDQTLEKAREDIESSLIDYIEALAVEQPERFKVFFQTHNLALMQLALVTPKLFLILIDYIEFETTRGVMRGFQLRTSGEPLVYAPTKEKYKQLSQLFFACDRLLINVAYVHACELLILMGKTFGLEVVVVEDWNIDDLLEELTPSDQNMCFEFVNHANSILKAYDCCAEVKRYSPYQQPAFYLIDENTQMNRQISFSRSKANSMFYGMLDAFAEDIQEDMAATLYFNLNNPIIKRLVQIEEEVTLKIFVEILYVQALQIGGYSLQNNELMMLNRNIMELMKRELR